MSLIFSIGSLEAPPQILFSRELQGVFGQTAQGLLDICHVDRPWLSYAACGQTYVLRSETAGLQLNGVLFGYRDETPLTEPVSITFEDRTFELFTTSPLAEVLSHSRASTQAMAGNWASLPNVCLSLAGAFRTYPLPPNCQVAIGASSDCAIQIKAAGVKPHHCSLYFNDCKVRISAEQGTVAIPDHAKSLNAFTETGTIFLEPIGIPLEIIFPAILSP